MKCAKKTKKRIIIAAIILLTVLLLFYIKNSLDKAVINYAHADVRNIMTKALNEAVLSVVTEKNVEYKDITFFSYDVAGNVRSVSVNTPYLNVLSAEITIKAMNVLSELPYRTFGIPIGNIIGSNISSGRGFKVRVSIVPLGSLSSDIRNEFKSVGINQTLHRIMVDINASVSVLAPFSEAEADINTSVCIAETVIVGSVPNTYFNYTN